MHLIFLFFHFLTYQRCGTGLVYLHFNKIAYAMIALIENHYFVLFRSSKKLGMRTF